MEQLQAFLRVHLTIPVPIAVAERNEAHAHVLPLAAPDHVVLIIAVGRGVADVLARAFQAMAVVPADALHVRDIADGITVLGEFLRLVFPGVPRAVLHLIVVAVARGALFGCGHDRGLLLVSLFADIAVFQAGSVRVLAELDLRVLRLLGAVDHIPVARAGVRLAVGTAVGRQPDIARRAVIFDLLAAPPGVADERKERLFRMQDGISRIVETARIGHAVLVGCCGVRVGQLQQILALVLLVQEVLRVVGLKDDVLIIEAVRKLGVAVCEPVGAVGDEHIDVRILFAKFAGIRAERHAVDARVGIAVADLFVAARDAVAVVPRVAHQVARVDGRLVEQNDADGVEPLLPRVHHAPELALVDLDDIELVRGLRLKRAVDVPVVIREAADVQPAVEAGQIARDLAGGHVDLADAIRIGHIHIAQIIVYAHALQMAGADLVVILIGRVACRHMRRIVAGLALRTVQRLLPLVAGNARDRRGRSCRNGAAAHHEHKRQKQADASSYDIFHSFLLRSF